MNGLVKKQPTAFGEVLLRWGGRVSTHRAKLIQAAQHARHDPPLGLGIPRVKTPLETNLKRHPFLSDSGKCLLRSRKIQRHRLLAKDGLAGFRSCFNQGSVGIRRRANDDGVNIVSAYYLLRKGSNLSCAN